MRVIVVAPWPTAVAFMASPLAVGGQFWQPWRPLRESLHRLDGGIETLSFPLVDCQIQRKQRLAVINGEVTLTAGLRDVCRP